MTIQVTAMSVFPEIAAALNAEAQIRAEAMEAVNAEFAARAGELAGVNAAVAAHTETLDTINATTQAQSEALAALTDKVKPVPSSGYASAAGLIGTNSTEFVLFGLNVTIAVQAGSNVVVWPKFELVGAGLVRVTRDGVESQPLDTPGNGLAVFQNLSEGEHVFTVEWSALSGVVETRGAREMLVQEVLK